MKNLKKAIFVLYLLVLTYLSVQKPGGSPPPFEHFDKLLHFGAYFVGFILGQLSLGTKNLLIVLTIYGVGIEILQGTLSYRDASFLDLVFNTLGWLVGFGFLKLIASRKNLGR